MNGWLEFIGARKCVMGTKTVAVAVDDGATRREISVPGNAHVIEPPKRNRTAPRRQK